MESDNTWIAHLLQNMQQDASHDSFCEAAARSQRKKLLCSVFSFFILSQSLNTLENEEPQSIYY